MQKAVSTAVALALLGAVLPARAETLGEKTGVNSALGVAPTTKDFVTEAANSDMFEIQSSKLAAAETDGPTKDFAKRMISDHTKTSDQLQDLASKAHVDVPSALDSSHQKLLDKLKGLKGEEFAKEYRSDQDAGHKEAVSLFSRYSDKGENAELKAWATKTLPTLKEHYSMAQNLDK